MPEIRISDEQRDRLQALQAEIDSELVGRYGHVRPQDALEFLLDRYEADVGLAAGDVRPGDVGEPSRSGSTDGEFDDAVEQEAADIVAELESDDDESGGDAGGDADEDGTTMLDNMMNLLDDHTDKWRESDGESDRYEVDLPDGSTEGARTKDDVRALLFKHYR